jgi:hypothetical protein
MMAVVGEGGDEDESGENKDGGEDSGFHRAGN